MYVQVRIVGSGAYDVITDTANYNLDGNTWHTLFNFNPDSEPPWGAQISYLCYSSGGIDATPIWLNYEVNLDPFAGYTIQLRYYFTSVDSLYNGFRGWGIDNVSITNEEPTVGFEFVQLNEWYYNTGCWKTSVDAYSKLMKTKVSR